MGQDLKRNKVQFIFIIYGKNFVVKDNSTAVVGILVYKNEVLFLKRKKPPLNWCPPCGRVEFNENLESALRREIK